MESPHLKERYERRFFSSDYSLLDRRLYQTTRENGVLFGCHLLNSDLINNHQELKTLSPEDRITFINLETLFECLMREIFLLVPHLKEYDTYLARVLIRIIQFYLGTEIKTNLFSYSCEKLLADSAFINLMSRFEERFSKRITITKKFNIVTSLQNSFIFLEVYGLVRWNRLFHQQSLPPIHFLQRIETLHLTLQKQLALILAGLIWLSHEESQHRQSLSVDSSKSAGNALRIFPKKMKMLERYIANSRLPKNEKKSLKRVVRSPVTIETIEILKTDEVINKFLLEQAILLSLMDGEIKPAYVNYIHELGTRLTVGEKELQASLSSVAEFFHQNEERFDFLRENIGFSYLRMRIQSQIALVVNKNLDRIMKEIKRTGQLYSLLVKSSVDELTEEEKRFIRQQLLSIAKTIPALAIFCLPAGGMVLAILVKVLPFNILPNSFAE